jgi:hypothetical protein
LNSDKLPDLVENYDQLAILLKNTQYGKYLDIPPYDWLIKHILCLNINEVVAVN